MLATVAAADSASTVRKKYSGFKYSEAAPHATYKQMLTLCVLQYIYMCVCVYIYVYIYICVCIYIYVCICVYIYIYIYKAPLTL